MPTISVIVPVYNTEEYLRRCVDSILAQTFTDFELILVDDGSTDSSGAICDEYAKEDSRVHVIHQENAGVSSARNAGLRAADGKCILFCDSDDYVAKEWAEILYTGAERFPQDLVVCDVALDGQALSQGILGEFESAIDAISYFGLYKKGLSGYPFNKIFRLDVIKREGIAFDESVAIGEDVAFNVSYFEKCRRVVLIAVKLYCYERTDSSATGQYRPNWFSLQLFPFRCRIPLIGKEDLSEYCSLWFYQFYHMFNNVFDPRNKEMRFFEKLRYNQKMLCSEEFQFCLDHADLKKENAVFVSLMKHKNYYLLWLVQRVNDLKHRIGGVHT